MDSENQVALEAEAQQLRKKIIKVQHLGFACPRSEIVEARRRLAEIDEMLKRFSRIFLEIVCIEIKENENAKKYHQLVAKFS